MNNLNIVYISSLVSKNIFDKIFSLSNEKPAIAPQKFHYLLVTGLTKFCFKVTSISYLPINSGSFYFKWLKNDKEHNVSFFYSPYVGFGLVRNLIIFLYTFFLGFVYSSKKNSRNSLIICDILNLTQSLSVIILSFLFRVKIVAIVTDLPELDLKKKGISDYFRWLHGKLIILLLRRYDSFILLTKYMEKFTEGKPSFILEGLVDFDSEKSQKKLKQKHTTRVILYAGGLYKEYGIDLLLKAFSKIKESNIALHLYGHGDMVEEIKQYAKNDDRIFFGGVIPNEQIIENLESSTLLINPRLTNQNFTLYSFPSKNIEFMASGTPLLTTKLKGIPDEYFKYCFTIDIESIEGIHDKIIEILSLDVDELKKIGAAARMFVIENKNNISQAKRLFDFLNKH